MRVALFKFWVRSMKKIRVVLSLILVLLFFYIYFLLRVPLTISLRCYDAYLILSLLLAFAGMSFFFRKYFFKTKFKRIFLFFWCVLLVSNGVGLLLKEGKFYYVRHRVYNYSPNELKEWGQHFIVGYRDFEDLKKLVSRGAVGGVYMTRRNIRGKTISQVRAEMDELQAIQKALGLPPLWIATDQEGGIVSRMSPLLSRQVSLSTLVRSYPEASERKRAIERYAKNQAESLKSLGINLNFSPVVDLKFKTTSSGTFNGSQIFKRAISSDPHIIAEVAKIYARTLLDNQIMPTLKHFPGLGRVSEDTHIEEAILSTDIETLRQQDWLPYYLVLKDVDSMLMLSHVKLKKIDEKNPSSVSHKLITGLLRQKWESDAILITDDFSMHPIFYRKGGIRKASVDALNAGVDLILVAYDEGLYFEAIDGVIQAARQKKLIEKNSAQTQKRVLRFWGL